MIEQPDSTTDSAEDHDQHGSNVESPDSTTSDYKTKKQKRSASENLRIKLKIDMVNGEVIQSFTSDKDVADSSVKTRSTLNKKLNDTDCENDEKKLDEANIEPSPPKRVKLIRTPLSLNKTDIQTESPDVNKDEDNVSSGETKSENVDASPVTTVRTRLVRPRRNISWCSEVKNRKRQSSEKDNNEPVKCVKEETQKDEDKKTEDTSNDVKRGVGREDQSDVEPCTKELFCWLCHKDGDMMYCGSCPRAYHVKCVSVNKPPPADSNWMCSVCCSILHAENTATRSPAMRSLTLNQLCDLLKFTLDRMKNVPQSEEFWRAVDTKEFPAYRKYISNPMDLNLLEKNIKSMMYGSTEAFLADTKWLYHNSVIFNSSQSPVTATARLLVKVCKQEMTEIENCPDCYLNAHTMDNWFLEICRNPHLLVWARLKGFPYWPAKVMTNKPQQVDVRFFGAHDKAWISVKECYLLSKNSPQPVSKKRHEWEAAVSDVKKHIEKILSKYGSFNYAADKTPYSPELHNKLMKDMIPNIDVGELGGEGEVKVSRGKKKKKAVTARLSVLTPDSVNMSRISIMSEENVTVEEETSCVEDEIAEGLESSCDNNSVLVNVDVDDDVQSDECGADPTPEHGYSRTESRLMEDRTPRVEQQMEEEEEDPELVCKQILQDLIKKVVRRERSWKRREENKAKKMREKMSEKDVKVEEENVKVKNLVVSLTKLDENVVATKTNKKEGEEKVSVEETAVKVESSNSLPNDKFKVLMDNEKLRLLCLSDGGGEKKEKVVEKVFDDLTCEEKVKLLGEVCLLSELDNVGDDDREKTLKMLKLDPAKVNVKLISSENKRILLGLKNKNAAVSGGKKQTTPPPQSKPDRPAKTSTTPITPSPPSSSSSSSSSSTQSAKSQHHQRSRVEPMVKIQDVESLKNFSGDCVTASTNKKKLKQSEKKKNELIAPKKENVALTNGHIVINNGSGGGVGGNTKYAIQQNDLGQISLVQLSNLTTGIQTNFVNLTNDTICNSGNSKANVSQPILLTTASVVKHKSERTMANNSVGAKGVISVKSAASLCNPPPLVLKPGLTELSRDTCTGSAVNELNKYSAIMAEHMKTTLESMLRDLGSQGCLEAKYKSLQIEVERLQWRNQQEIIDIRQTAERNMAELRKTMESEKQQALLELKLQLESRYDRLISETKKKQWCANCGNEALFYCCWNTSYCDYPCQKAHWLGHMNKCAQLGNSQPPPPNSIQNLTQRRLQQPGVTMTPYHFFA